jgi:hypothetical protein
MLMIHREKIMKLSVILNIKWFELKLFLCCLINQIASEMAW